MNRLPSHSMDSYLGVPEFPEKSCQNKWNPQLAGIVLQPHLPDRNCAYVDLCPRPGKETALDFGKSPGRRHQVIHIECIEENAHLRYN